MQEKRLDQLSADELMLILAIKQKEDMYRSKMNLSGLGALFGAAAPFILQSLFEPAADMPGYMQWVISPWFNWTMAGLFFVWLVLLFVVGMVELAEEKTAFKKKTHMDFALFNKVSIRTIEGLLMN